MSATESARPRSLRRDRSHGAVAGVCAGIAKQTGIDVLLVRIVFFALVFAGGFGIVLYALLWALVPAEGEEGRATIALPRLQGRGAIQVALGAGLLLLSLLLTLRALGVWMSDLVVWPVVLVCVGGALLWREAGARSSADPVAEPAPPDEEPVVTASRTGIGVALVIAAGVAFLASAGALSAARDVLLSVFVVAVVFGVIFGPWIVRLARSLADERAERVRTQERAEISAHLHDSVLQTLALVQQRSDDPKAVEALARRQERELRAWLGRRAAPGGAATLGAALEAAAGEVERDHGARVEVVSVGEVPLDERTQALVAATREAMVNAAKFGGGSVVDVFAEADPERIEVFVRDRGPGFDQAAVAPDRRGVRESIVGRMERHGGRAVINSRPGEGTEVELSLPVKT
ncbi:MAG TPA: PspC domain-containing protein [Thermoleophilaceae bacterium]|nr:PspC domain-containing protein [Thermoleophilaceae bacterium]